jgi:hypothetical protein
MKRELDTRTTQEGIEVRLLWDDQSGEVEIVLTEPFGGPTTSTTVSAHAARDAFDHPYLYADADEPALN